jgi:hypothetical protein
MHPLPSINHVYSMIIQQERKLFGDISSSPNTTLSVAAKSSDSKPVLSQSPLGNNFVSYQEKVCSYCNKLKRATLEKIAIV